MGRPSSGTMTAPVAIANLDQRSLRYFAREFCKFGSELGDAVFAAFDGEDGLQSFDALLEAGVDLRDEALFHGEP